MVGIGQGRLRCAREPVGGWPVLFDLVSPKTQLDIWVLPLEGERKSVSFQATQAFDAQARFSPDGHWVAYTSDEPCQNEVYVRSFSMNSAGTAIEASGKWPISNGFGTSPHWRGDGKELYYRSQDGHVMAVETANNPAFRAGSPHPFGLLVSPFWESAADGTRFLSLAQTAAGPPTYTVVLN